MIVAIESEPRTGKDCICSLIIRNFRYTSGNLKISETLRGLVCNDQRQWCFEYLLSLILNFVVVPSNENVVYKNLLMKETLLKGFRDIQYIDDMEFTILERCCKLFIPKIVPDLVIYSSTDENLIASFCTGHFKKGKLTLHVAASRYFKESFSKVLENINQQILRIDCCLPFTDSVINAQLVEKIREKLDKTLST
jgi:hypothetical protein